MFRDRGPVDPDSAEIVNGGIEEQTARTLENISAILETAGASLDDVVNSTVSLTDMEDYEAFNDVYREYMDAPFPARSAVQVADLPIDIDVEIETTARP